LAFLAFCITTIALNSKSATVSMAALKALTKLFKVDPRQDKEQSD
jgi:hypothetical protein